MCLVIEQPMMVPCCGNGLFLALETGMLFTPYRLGELALPNRIVMPPMTRCRVGDGDVPTALMAEYYAQRASAGLIVSEGTPISP